MRTYQMEVSRAGTVASISTEGGLINIPLNINNRDCIQFLADWKAGATVTNDDGSPAPYSDAAARALGLSP